MHIDFGVSESSCEALQGKGVDSLEELFQKQVIRLPRGDDPKLALGHPFEYREEATAMIWGTKALYDRFLHNSLPTHDCQRPHIVGRYEPRHVQCADLWNAHHQEDVPEPLVLLSPYRIVDLVRCKRETIIRLKAHIASRIAEERPMELDVEPADRIPLAVEEAVVSVSP